ncbi:MAG: hypothetical protein CSA62_03890 [Planctomycetota bacterium]|nr:MAG: hypothetical protein CSA62_03890 [Planctomycetota bacterium]
MPVPRYPHFPRWTWAHRSTALAFLLALTLGSELWWPYLRGSLSSTRLFGIVPFADPLSALEQMLAARRPSFHLALGLGLVTAVYLLLGRLFCGWLCPFGLVLELLHAGRERLARVLWKLTKRRLPSYPAPTWPKYFLLLLFLLTSLQVALPVFGMVSPIQWMLWALTFRGDFLLGGLFIAVMLAILVLEFLVPRVFCRSLCPIGALYALLGSWSPLRIRIHPKEAGRRLCQQCSIHCPMGIDVMKGHVLAGHSSVSDPECTRCGTCLDVCRGDGVLSLSFRDHPPEDPTDLSEECAACPQEGAACESRYEF